MSQGIIARRGGSAGSNQYQTINFDLPVLKASTPTPLSVGRTDLAATSVGNYALFGGGRLGNAFYDEVDAYKFSARTDIQLYPGTKYSFNGESEQVSSTFTTLNLTTSGGLTGYLKIKKAKVN